MQLIPEQPSKKFNKKMLQNILTRENAFITDLFSKLPIPKSAQNNESESDDEMSSQNQQKDFTQLNSGQNTRAKSLVELHKRLAEVRTKQKLNYKEKLLKKNIKNKIKKKNKLDERNAKQKLIRAAKLIEKDNTIKNEVNVTTEKPKFNEEEKMVFSKFDFSNVGNKKPKKQIKDPKKNLENIQKQQEKLKELEASGEKEKAIEVKEKFAWKSALAKAEGVKVRDDPDLLKKSVKKQEQKKRQSKKKWETRQEGVKKAQDEKQKKRSDNIMKRKKEKKVKKLKTAAKRGRIIAGF